ncbi:TetR family transcriptional regulator [Paenibacillus sp. LMG 31460]|uniref:TetR family transcriptional regulator n=1 Tax=Paenibacillus germinis TaxID=2654979 RepID=A0ABX1YWM6_9BACL|nr:TetR family transcriptional regulator C-terminal domain-containing protein [Paenibacillus germinis]NOU85323.1 TetR family transcriptional regulator [Paenibacillus germinis]
MSKTEARNKQMELIADATFRVIQSVGLEQTTIRKIAKEAGLSLGTVQYYFPTQQDIYLYSMEQLSKRILERIVQSVQKGDPVFEGVVTMLKQFISNQDQDPMIENEVWLSFSLMALRDQALEHLSSSTHQSTREFMELILNILQQNNYLRDALDLEMEAMNLHAFIDGLSLHAILYPNSFDEKMIENRIKDYLRNKCK